MNDSQRRPPAVMEVQWNYLNELKELGYDALCKRSGEDEDYDVCGPEGEPFLIRTIIHLEAREGSSVWVHTEAFEHEDAMPWHAGFTMSPAGTIEDH